MKKKLLPVFLLLLIFVQTRNAQAQVTLATSPYTQDFNLIGASLPTGWSVRTGATASALGTVATLTTTATAWNNSAGAFKNFASATGFIATTAAATSTTDQTAATNRSLGVRQTGSFGDPGAAFVLQLNNTAGISGFSLSFKLQSLDGGTAARSATWKVDYGFGAAPSSFTAVTTSPATLTTTLSPAGWGSTGVTVNFGTALDNQSGNVWIRIITLTATTGSGSRPSTAIDDAQLSFIVGDIAPPTFSVTYPKASNYTVSGVDLLTNLSEPGKTYFVVVPDGATAPTAAQVKAGQDASGNSVAAGFSGVIIATDASIEYSSTLSALNSSTDYDVYLASEDNIPNLQTSVTKLDIRTNTIGDLTAPGFTANYPSVDLITATGFKLKTNLDEQGRTYFVVLTAGANAPTSTQIKNGDDASNISLASNLRGVIGSPVNAAEFSTVVNGLTPETSYDIYFATEDNVPNLQVSPSKVTALTGKQFLESFDDCDGTASFTSFSVIGDQVWGCTDFGRNATKGIRMNGFGSSAVLNEDWLISPVVSLTSNPSLSFYSQFSFAGNSLQLKISTDYLGTGAPSTATWTDINGNFPTLPVGSSSTALSDWTLSNVDLSAYANQKVYVAFVYTSTAAAAARWTLDEVTFNNGAASFMKTTPSGLSFNSSGVSKSYVLKGFNLLNNVTITAPTNFQTSKDNITFSSSIAFTAAEVNAQQTVYIKFAVTGVATDTYIGTVSNASAGVSTKLVQVKGADLSQTFEITAYNLEFFGTDVRDASNVEFGPTDDLLQVNNVTTVLKNLASDIYGVEEIADDNAFNQLVTNLPGYDKVVSPRWSYSFDPPDPNFPPQKIGFIYNTSTVHLINTRVMFVKLYDDIKANVVTLPSYPGATSSSFWSSGRLPFMATFDVTINGVTRRLRMIDIHAKSGSAQDDYDRRKYDVQVLHDSLTVNYPTDKIILLGDYNDDVDNSINVGAPSSYKTFVDDTGNFNTLTSTLSATPGASTFPNSNSFLDHIIVSNEMTKYYVANSITIEDARNYIPNYVNTTSDHLPITARFLLSVKDDQTVTFDAISDKTEGDLPFSLTATTSSALPVTFSTPSDKVTINGNQVTIVKPGRAIITASQVGNADFNAVSADQSFCIKPTKPSITLTNGNTVGLTLTSSASNGNQWFLNDAAIGNATSSTITVAVAGIYKVQVKADDCLSDFSANSPVVVTGDLNKSGIISIYPNPVDDQMHITGINDVNASYLYDMSGHSTKIQLDKFEDGHHVNVGYLSAGIYIIRIQDGATFHQLKFVKK